ncbi:lysM domain receptor-like kinase 4 [Telopea speciosissima]|uniref:lysM domain receptor-like kinase 4 n=1 Tax=Telopea speciosissima TaxID=54955 RepID=UPI001CC6EFD2|nr:lysM domain receptor-like kinase 4 [Telopea speciosissima]
MGVLQFLILVYVNFLISFSSDTLAQQPYVGKAITACGNTNTSTSVLGYSYNGINQTCQSYLIFRSQHPYDTVLSIAGLLGSDPSQLAQINSVSDTATFETKEEVIVPINCSCSGQYYQANTTYSVQPNDTPFVIANDTFQGLSTCQAIQNQDNTPDTNLKIGQRIPIPLRCACPTKNQTDYGIKYLLSYIIIHGDTVFRISTQFGANTTETLAANGLSENSVIYPSTTLLVPLRNPPSLPPPPPSPPSSASQSKASNKTLTYLVIAVGIAIILVIFLISLFFFLHTLKRNKTDLMLVSKSSKVHSIVTSDPLESSELLAGIAQSIKVYKFDELQSATKNFSPNCRISGSVYRGTINGDLAAIKKINGDISKEINFLSKINHFNIIRLSGVCFGEGNWYFVYEYAMNGPLSNWIHGNMSRPKNLSWTQRVQIALDVAMGLNYLHSYTNPPYVHKDIRSINILLDSDLRAKIANFGLARSTVGQTKGYMAPEYLEDGLVSPKLDVYAFGVVMLELISGKEIVSSQGEELLLIDVLIAILHEENVEEKLRGFIDPSLQENYPLDLAVSLGRLIESCLSKNPVKRPGMDKIVQSLSTIVAISPTWESSL